MGFPIIPAVTTLYGPYLCFVLSNFTTTHFSWCLMCKGIFGEQITKHGSRQAGQGQVVSWHHNGLEIAGKPIRKAPQITPLKCLWPCINRNSQKGRIADSPATLSVHGHDKEMVGPHVRGGSGRKTSLGEGGRIGESAWVKAGRLCDTPPVPIE